VLGVRPADPHALDAPEQLHQLETFANQTALAIERARLAEEASDAQIRMETERLRNSLLSSVSHEPQDAARHDHRRGEHDPRERLPAR